MSFCKACQTEYQGRCKPCHNAQQEKCRKSDPIAYQAQRVRHYQERKERLKAKKANVKKGKNATPGIITHYMDDDLRHREACQRAPRPGIQSGLG